MRSSSLPHRRWPLVVKPNLEALEERYAPGKTVELFEPSFILPALLKNAHAPTTELRLLRQTQHQARKTNTRQEAKQPWYAASLVPMQMAGFRGVGTRDGAYFQSHVSTDAASQLFDDADKSEEPASLDAFSSQVDFVIPSYFTPDSGFQQDLSNTGASFTTFSPDAKRSELEQLTSFLNQPGNSTSVQMSPSQQNPLETPLGSSSGSSSGNLNGNSGPSRPATNGNGGNGGNVARGGSPQNDIIVRPTTWADWTFEETGGVGASKGSYWQDGADVILREGNSFTASLWKNYSVPTNPRNLIITYDNLAFDTSVSNRIKDAFEIGFVNPVTGQTQVYPYTRPRDAAYNVTDGVATPGYDTAHTQEEVVSDGKEIRIDISQLDMYGGTTPATQFKVFVRLVNNDQLDSQGNSSGDENTQVRIRGQAVSDPAPEVTVGLLNDTFPVGAGAPYTTDKLTNDPTLTGTATDNIQVTMLEASIDSGAFQDITSSLSGSNWTWNPGVLAAGQHTIAIRAKDNLNQTTIQNFTFTVNSPPNANAGGNRSTNEGTTLNFDAIGSTDLEGIYSFRWTMPDSSIVNGQTANYLFTDNGVFSVSVQVTDTAGSIHNDTISVTVGNVQPSVTVVNITGNEGQLRNLSASFTDPSLVDTHSATINWGDGTTTPGTVDPVLRTVSGSHVYADNAVYTITVTVADDDNGIGQGNGSSDISNVAPTVTPASNQTINEGSTLNITIATFTDPGFSSPSAGTVETFTATVDWGDGSAVEPADVNVTNGSPGVLTTGTVTKSHLYLQNGTYSVVVTVTDDNGGFDTKSFQVTVNNVAPVVMVPALTGDEGQSRSLVASFTDVGTLDTHTAIINWGDGNSGPGTVDPVLRTVTGTHTYADNGNYTVTVTVTDNASGVGVGNNTATISNVIPTLNAIADQTAFFSTQPPPGTTRTISFTSAFTDPGILDTHTATVNWGNGITTPGDITETNGSGTVSKSYTYPANGVYTVTVTLTDKDGGQTVRTFRAYIGGDGFQVPGDETTSWLVQFDFLGGDAGFDNELGLFVTENAQGLIGGKTPGQSGYAQTAINHSSRHIVLPREYVTAWKAAPSGSKPPRSFTVTLVGGSHVAFYLVQNNTTATWLTNNPGTTNTNPVAFFSQPLANPDSQAAHFKVLSVAGNGTLTYGVEDLASPWTGNEPDYNDFQFTLSTTQVTGSPATKFFVTNNGATAADDKVYHHASSGATINAPVVLDAANTNPIGTTSNYQGNRLWVIDTNKNIYVYDTTTNTLLGSWSPKTNTGANLSAPTDIGTDGSIIWVVDNPGSNRRVYRYANTGANTGADRISGTQNALAVGTNGSINLNGSNTTPTGLAVNASRVFVTNSGTREVFVYDRSTVGYLGKWKLDPNNTNPTDITTEPTGANTFGNHLWVVDKTSKEIFFYENSVSWTANPTSPAFRTAKASYALRITKQANGDNITVNTVAEGIADPPPPINLTVHQPDNNDRLLSGQSILVSGQATLNGAPVARVAINGSTVTSLDSAGNFFDQFVLSPGVNQYVVSAYDAAGESVSQTVSVTGYQLAAGQLDFDLLTDVTPSFQALYGRTSYDKTTTQKLLYSDVQARNVSTIFYNTPLVMGIKNISVPSVTVRNSDGTLPGNIAYINYSSLFTDALLDPNQTSSAKTIEFSNPSGLPFTYDVVFFARINHAPAFTSIPNLDGRVGQAYAYVSTAADRDDDSLTYYGITLPAGMTVNSQDGTVNWTPTAAGTYTVTLGVHDGRGGKGTQTFVIRVPGTNLNRPPHFITIPVVDAQVNTAYQYDSEAVDPDEDVLTYSRLSFTGSDGTSNNPPQINGSSGLVTWTPVHAQLGINHLTIQADDGHGGIAIQQYDILVQIQPSNHPPAFVTQPATTFVTVGPVRPSTGIVSPTSIAEEVGAGQTIQRTVSITIPAGTPSGIAPAAIQYNQETGVLRGSLFEDLDADGQADPGEPSLSSWTVYLDNNHNNQLDGGEPSTTTATNGSYQFTGLAPGTYTVAQVPLSGWIQTAPGVGGRWKQLPDLALGVEGAAGNVINGILYVSHGAQRTAVGAAAVNNNSLASWNPATELWTNLPSAAYARREVGGATDGRFHYVVGGRYTDPVLGEIGANFLEAYDTVTNTWATLPSMPVGRQGIAAAYSNNLLFAIGGFDNNTTPADDGYRVDIFNPATATWSQGANMLIPVRDHYATIALNGKIYVFNGRSSQSGGAGQTTSVDALQVYDIASNTWSFGPAMPRPRYGSMAGVFGGAIWVFGGVALPPTIPGEDPPPLSNSPPGEAWTEVFNPVTGTWSRGPDMAVNSAEMAQGLAYSETLGAFAVGRGYRRSEPYFQQLIPTYGTHTVTIYSGEGASNLIFGNNRLPATIDLESSDPTVNFENLSGPATSITPGQTLNFTVQMTGDGQAHDFDIRFVEPALNRLLGTIPVTFNGNYLYSSLAVDPDLDPVSYRKLTGPGTFNTTTGHLEWRPTVPGQYTFSLEASDGRGGIDIQTWTVNVVALNANNQPPQINNTPPTTASVDRLYGHRILASDPENDQLRYYLTAGPSGLTLDPASGIIQWTPELGQVGSLPVSIVVTDGRNGSASQNWTITVDPPTYENQSPQFTNTPTVLDATVGEEYTFSPRAYDPDGDALSYDAPVKPPGMIVDPVTGYLNWIPTLNDLGEKAVLLRVRDGSGGVDLMSFRVRVNKANLPPEFSSNFPGQATAGRPYRFNVRAVDPEQDTITLLANGLPAWLTFHDEGDGYGYLIGTAPAPTTFPLTLVASDNQGGTRQQYGTFEVVAEEPNHAPVILSQAPLRTQLGLTYRYPLVAIDEDFDALAFSFQTAPPGMQIDPISGMVTWDPQQVGDFPVNILVEDGRGGQDTESFTVVVRTTASNQPPDITSTPSAIAIADREYVYQAVATDQDGDPLGWQLVQAPDNMWLDPITGLIRWTPSAQQVGNHTVKIRVMDFQGGSATQTYTLMTRGTNQPPRFDSTPPVSAQVGYSYVYFAHAADPDNDIVQYSLVPGQFPTNMSIPNPLTGQIVWIPNSSQVGTHTVKVKAEDSFGGVDYQTYQITVALTANQPPSITNLPSTTATVGQLYQYTIQATDPNNDTLYYEFTSSPTLSNMSLVGNVLSWTPTAPQAGTTYAIRVLVADRPLGHPQRATAWLDYQLNPIVNNAPTLNDITNRTLTVGQPFALDAQATDQDGDPLSYSITRTNGTLPNGLTIDQSGRIRWTQTVVGAYDLQVTVNDNRGGSVSDTFTLNIVADTQAPLVQVIATPSGAIPINQTVQFQVLVSDNVGIASRTLKIYIPGNPTPVEIPLDASGFGSYTPTVAYIPNYEARGSAVDVNNNSSNPNDPISKHFFQVTDPSQSGSLTVTLNPLTTNNAPVTAPTDVVGTVVGTYQDWRLLAVSNRTGTITVIKDWTATAPGNPLARFDPTLLENGMYVIRLEARNLGGTVYAEQEVQVTGRLKLGNFAVSFTDLTIPVAGIPISVGRSYDTLRANQNGELGYGWQLTMGDAQLETTLDPNSNVGTFGGYPAFLDGTRVYVTFPGGDRQGFTFTPIRYSTFPGVYFYSPAFTPDPGNNYALLVEDFTLVKQTNESYVFTDYQNSYLYNPTRPIFGAQYTLLDIAGTKHTVDARDGKLLSVEDRRGNKLTYEDDQIVSNRFAPAIDVNGNTTGLDSTSKIKVSIERDPTGRIIAVRDPRGNAVTYQYDSQENLVGVTDRLGHTTQISYKSTTGSPAWPAHYLDQVTDPLGRVALTANYDDGSTANGSNKFRLKNLTDAQSQTTRMDYDVVANPTAPTQSIVDPVNYALNPTNPAKTTVTYDAKGNVTNTLSPTGEQTVADYSDQPGDPANPKALYLPKKVTQVVGAVGGPDDIVSTVKYDAVGNVVETTDPLSKTSYMSYNAYGQPLSASDPLGNTVLNSYDEETGNLLSTQSPGQPVSTFAYNDRNDLTSVTVAGVTSTSDYFDVGWKKSDTRVGIPGQPSTNVTTSYKYNGNGNSTGSSYTYVDYFTGLTKVVTSSTVYDDNDRATGSTDADGNTSSAGYDNLDRAISSTDSFGQTSYTKYDSRGLVIESTSSLGTISRTVYDANGRTVWTVDDHLTGQQARGTKNYYDTSGRVTKTERYDNVVIDLVNLPDGSQSTVLTTGTGLLSTSETFYDALGRVDHTVSPTGLVTSFTYDKRGQQLSTTMVVTTLSGNQTITTSTTYDDAGKTLTTTDPLGRVTRPVYDQYSRPYKTIFADSSFTEMGYDSRGRKEWEREQRKNADPIRQTDYEYDDLGRLTAVVQPLVDNGFGTPTRPRYEYTYDRFGNHVKTKDALNRETLFAYDFAGRQTSRTLPDALVGENDTETWEYSTAADVVAQLYPNVGMLKRHTDFAGNKNEPHYDDRGRVDLNTWRLPNNTIDQQVSYHYDTRGRMDSYTDSRGTTNYTFDLESRTIQIASPEGTLNYEYNQTNGWHTRTYTNHNDTSYAYDQAGRLEKITVSKLGDTVYSTGNELTTTYGYNAAGLLTTILRKNGASTIAKTENTYDILNRVETITQKNAADVAFANYTYTRKSDGKISRVLETISGVQRQSDYVYDALGRLTNETYSISDPASISYVYDVVGNRLQQTKTGPGAGITDYVYDARDRLQSETNSVTGITTYGYDANGSQVTKDAPGIDIETYLWNARNRLSGAAISRSGVTTNTSYQYDDGGIRTQVTENAVTTKHLIDSMNPTGYAQVIEQTQGGVLLVSTVYGMEPIAQKDSSGISLYLADAHSGTRFLVDVLTNVLAQYTYDSLGNLQGSPLSGVTIPILYRGERFDATLQNYYLRARYYNQTTGRFGAVDPIWSNITDPRLLNKYNYTACDPINMIDPSGQMWTFSNVMSSIGNGLTKIATTMGGILRTIQATTRLFASYIISAAKFLVNTLKVVAQNAYFLAQRGVSQVGSTLYKLLTDGIVVMRNAATGGWRVRMLNLRGTPGRPSYEIFAVKNWIRLEAHPIKSSWPWWVMYPHLHIDKIASISKWHLPVVETIAIAAVLSYVGWRLLRGTTTDNEVEHPNDNTPEP